MTAVAVAIAIFGVPAWYFLVARPRDIARREARAWRLQSLERALRGDRDD